MPLPAGYLVASAMLTLICCVAVVIVLRRGIGPLWLQLSLTYALGVGLALINVYAIAQLMFISAREVPLLVWMLLFAGGVSLVLGIALAITLTRRVTRLQYGARQLARGDLQARVIARGNDELAALAHEFNAMAAQLAAGDAARTRQEDARRELIAAVSHDLRTPLASLRALVEAFADGLVDDPATTRRYLDTMRNQVGTLSRLIDDLFELSRIDAGALTLDLQRVAVSELVNDALDALGPQARARGITLRSDLPAILPPLRVDAQQIARVLANLVSNALRHTPQGGTITLSIHIQPDARITINVIDDGEGIAPEDLPQIFARFYRGEKSRSRATGGAGLGLAIARGIVEAHGGTIAISSELGRGTTVTFTLPGAD